MPWMTEEDVAALAEYQDRDTFKCLHGHNGLSHKNCWKLGTGKIDRIGFLDIESSDLNADWGFVYSYCLKKLDGKMIKRTIKGSDVINYKIRDKFLIKQFIEDIQNFDALVVYYGKDTGGRYQRHDIPFLRTRAEFWGIKNFPKDGEKIIIDLYDVAKAKLKLKSNSLAYVCKFKGIPCKQTPLSYEMWQRARDGNDKSLRYILKHCQEDVISTELLYKDIYPYKRVKGKI